MIILGLSGALGHDPAACLVIDGRVVAMVEEERLSRVKHGRDQLPINATNYCLGHAGISIDDVDYIAVSWEPKLDPGVPIYQNFLPHLLVHDYFRPKTQPKVEYVHHHLAHAASAFYSSGFPEAAVLVVDGVGEDSATSIGVGRGTGLHLEQNFGPRHSLGHYYSFAAEHTGLGSGHEGKLMGLAAYGEASVPVDVIKLEPDGYRIDLPGVGDSPMRDLWAPLYEGWTKWFTDNFSAPNKPRFIWDTASGRTRRVLDLPPWCANLAASVQAALVEALLHLARVATERYRTRRLVIAGGVGLNCSANGVISRSGIIDDLFITPAAHDAGGALGAALYVAAQLGKVAPPSDVALGPSFATSDVAALLRRNGVRFTDTNDVAAHTADLLARGKAVGWFQGRSEVGPRALGQRSILAVPDSVETRDRINQIKGREAWRPLSPSVLASHAASLLTDRRHSPHMLVASSTTDLARTAIPAAVHVDGTARPQHVTDQNGVYHRLLTKVLETTGVPAVLNTSFNVAGEPIVGTPFDAVRTFFSSGLDALVIEDLVVEKT